MFLTLLIRLRPSQNLTRELSSGWVGLHVTSFPSPTLSRFRVLSRRRVPNFCQALITLYVKTVKCEDDSRLHTFVGLGPQSRFWEPVFHLGLKS